MKELQRNDEAFLNLHQTLVCYANDVPLQEDGGEKNLDGSFTSSNNTTLTFSICYQTGLQQQRQHGNQQQRRAGGN